MLGFPASAWWLGEVDSCYIKVKHAFFGLSVKLSLLKTMWHSRRHEFICVHKQNIHFNINMLSGLFKVLEVCCSPIKNCRWSQQILGRAWLHSDGLEIGKCLERKALVFVLITAEDEKENGIGPTGTWTEVINAWPLNFIIASFSDCFSQGLTWLCFMLCFYLLYFWLVTSKNDQNPL